MVREHVGPVWLDPIPHIYIHRETGDKYSSVTQAISSIEKHFDTEGVAQAIANKSDSDPTKNPDYIGMSKDRLVNHWQEINDAANEFGTMVHEIVERYLLANHWYTPANDFEDKVIQAYRDLKVDEGQTVWPERIMFSEEYKLAGTADLVIDIDDEYFDIGDWKTNRVFNFYSPYKQQLLPPFSHLQDCQFTVYTIQLSTYARMYEEETGKKCRQIWVGYFDREAISFSKIQLMYMKHEAEMLMKLHRYNLELKNAE